MPFSISMKVITSMLEIKTIAMIKMTIILVITGVILIIYIEYIHDYNNKN